jgi:hypothetical protein
MLIDSACVIPYRDWRELEGKEIVGIAWQEGILEPMKSLKTYVIKLIFNQDCKEVDPIKIWSLQIIAHVELQVSICELKL